MTDLPSDPWKWTACQAVGALKDRTIAPVELIDAAVARIEAVDGPINALPIRCFERAREQASNEGLRDTPLAGLPIAVKDYNDVGGVRTTYGSPIFADNVPARSDATVQRLEANGAIPIAKSNVPEWAGGHTFNPVNGLTRNPWNMERSAGGSSGGSAAALASGQIWLATGNDLGGSLRTPAAFNGVVGLRPSPGLVPRGRRHPAFDVLWVEGPMARNVADVALMLDAGAGAHPDDPLAFTPAESFLQAAQAPRRPLRIGFSPDLGGAVPMAREIASVAGDAMARLAGEAVDVKQSCPDFTGAFDAFQSLRGILLGAMMSEMLDEHRDRISPDIASNVELGLAQTPETIFRAEQTRTRLSHAMTDFFADHDLLICPATSIPPFPVEQPFVTEIDGKACDTYIDWFAVTFLLTLTACPVLSLPCGLTADGLPVGLQIVGKPRGEADLLAAAAWMEQVFSFSERVPLRGLPTT